MTDREPRGLPTCPPGVGEAFRALQALTPDQRGLVLCWFCAQCFKYIPPGESCIHDDPECYFCGHDSTKTR